VVCTLELISKGDIFLKLMLWTVLRIRDVYPFFTHPGSRITDLGSRMQQKRGAKKIFIIPFYVATNFTKFKIILVLKC
jgi:hypothetical protein